MNAKKASQQMANWWWILQSNTQSRDFVVA